MIKFSVSGNPRPRQSVRSRIGEKGDGSQFIHHYQKKNDPAAQWMERLRTMAKLHAPEKPLDGPLFMKVDIRRQKTATYKKSDQWPHRRPDIDNYLKPLLDSFTGVLYTDDARICQLLVIKKFSDSPGVDIEIYELEGTGGH